MLTTDEKKFLEYWEKNRLGDKNSFKQFRYALLIGVGLAALILLNFASGWYARATMVANSQSTPIVIIIAIVAIVIFWSVFSSRHKREMNEQRYQELLFKQKKEINKGAVQHDGTQNGQIDTNL